MASRTKKTKSDASNDAFSELTWDDLEEWAGSRIVARGRSYQRKGAVRELQRDEEDALVAWVEGSRLYAARVSIEGSKDLIGECTCPYWTTCKHAVAVVVEYLEMVKTRTAVGRVEADDPRLEELDVITEDDEETLEFDVEEDHEEEPPELDLDEPDEESAETLSESSGTGQSGDASLRAYLQEHTKAELVELLLELAETHDEVRQSLENRRSLTSGETRRVLKRIRSEIAALEEPEWESHHYGGYQVRNTGRWQGRRGMVQVVSANRPAAEKRQETKERPEDGLAAACSGSRNTGPARSRRGAYGRRADAVGHCREEAGRGDEVVRRFQKDQV